MMSDWIGVLFFVAFAATAILLLRKLSRPMKRTEQEFERRAEESASLLGAGISALQGMLQPQERRATEAVREFREERTSKEAKIGEVPNKNIGTAEGTGPDLD